MKLRNPRRSALIVFGRVPEIVNVSAVESGIIVVSAGVAGVSRGGTVADAVTRGEQPLGGDILPRRSAGVLLENAVNLGIAQEKPLAQCGHRDVGIQMLVGVVNQPRADGSALGLLRSISFLLPTLALRSAVLVISANPPVCSAGTGVRGCRTRESGGKRGSSASMRTTPIWY